MSWGRPPAVRRLMDQVVGRLVDIHRLQGEPNCQTLAEGGKFCKAQGLGKKGLPPPAPPGALALARLQVAQKAQLLQQVGGEILRFIYNEDRFLSGRVLSQQVIGQGQPQGLFAATLERQGQIEEDGLQKTRPAAEVTVGKESADDLFSEALEQAPAQQGFAEAGTAGEQDQAFLLGQGLLQPGQGLLVRSGRIIAAGVRDRSKRTLPEAEVGFVHRERYPPCRVRRRSRSYRLYRLFGGKT